MAGLQVWQPRRRDFYASEELRFDVACEAKLPLRRHRNALRDVNRAARSRRRGNYYTQSVGMVITAIVGGNKYFDFFFRTNIVFIYGNT